MRMAFFYGTGLPRSANFALTETMAIPGNEMVMLAKYT